MLWHLLSENLPYLLEGLGVTLLLLLLLLALGLAVGVALSLYQTVGPSSWLLQLPATVFERVFRGIPIIVLLFIFYYGLAALDLSSFAAAVLALGLRSGAYQAQIFRSAIQSVPKGQYVSARAMGLGTTGALAFVVLPQAFRFALGPWTNEFSSEIKATALAYVIGVVELTRQANYIVTASSGHVLGVFGAAAVLYFIVNKTGNSLLYALERRVRIPGGAARA